MPISTVLFESFQGMSRPPIGLVFLNPRSVGKKVIFMLTAKPFASIDIPVMGRSTSHATQARSFVIISSPAGRAQVWTLN